MPNTSAVPATRSTKIAQGSAAGKNGKHVCYKADTGKEVYQTNRQACAWMYRCVQIERFLQYVAKMFREKGWSLDACVGKALKSGEFSLVRRSSAQKTLYNYYVDLGLLLIKNIDLPGESLPEKLSRNKKKAKSRENKRKLGRSIEDRPENVGLREEFGQMTVTIECYGGLSPRGRISPSIR